MSSKSLNSTYQHRNPAQIHRHRALRHVPEQKGFANKHIQNRLDSLLGFALIQIEVYSMELIPLNSPDKDILVGLTI
jgi:hypothetical protein